MQVVWSKHACHRARERLPDWWTHAVTPRRAIVKESIRRRIGEDFRIVRAGLVYVCKKINASTIVVVTVFPKSIANTKGKCHGWQTRGPRA